MGKNSSEFNGRGGEGGIIINGRPYFPVSDGHGCPTCGAVYPGGHGGFCNFGRHFDVDGGEIVPIARSASHGLLLVRLGVVGKFALVARCADG